MDNKENKRHTELSIIFNKMGKALIVEGTKESDTNTRMLGNILLFSSVAIKKDDELKQLTDFCTLIACKRLINNIRGNMYGNSDYLVGKMGEIEKLNLSDEELIDVIKMLRKKFGLDDSE